MTVLQYLRGMFKFSPATGPDYAELKYQIHKNPLVNKDFGSFSPSYLARVLTEAQVYKLIQQCTVLDAKYMIWPGPYGYSRRGEGVHEFIRFRIMCPDEGHPQSKPQQPFHRIVVIDIPRNTWHSMYCCGTPTLPNAEPEDNVVIYGCQHNRFRPRFGFDYRSRLQRSMEFTSTCRPSILQVTSLLQAVSEYRESNKLVLSEHWYSQTTWEALLALFSPRECRPFYLKLFEFGGMYSSSRITKPNSEKLQVQTEEIVELYEEKLQEMQDRGDANLKAARQAFDERKEKAKQAS